MFSIITTQKILEELYLQDSVWGDIIAHTNCFYIDFDPEYLFGNNESNHSNESALDSLVNSRANIRIIDGAAILEGIERHPETIAQYPSSVFILDIEKAEAAELQKRYGVLVLSYNSLDDDTLTKINVKNVFTVEEGEVVDFGWPEIFAGIKDIPTNSIIINDRNLFTNDDIAMDASGAVVEKRLFGIDSTFSILDAVMPQNLDVTFHIIVVCDKSGIDGEGGRKHKNLRVKNVIKYLNELKKLLNRPYPIEMELLAVTLSSALYTATHNRRILTNYSVIFFDYKINAFRGLRSNASQTIFVTKLFSHDNLRGEQVPPFLKEYNRLTKALHNYFEDITAKSDRNEHEFAKNGKAGLTFDTTEHRMIV